MPQVVQHAVVAVLRRGDRVLVVKRGPGTIMPGYWCPPSGRIEEGESQEQAVAREIEEELGVRAAARDKVWECPTDDGAFLLHWWTADIPDVDFFLDPDEIADARWVTREEFHELQPIFEGDRRFFSDVLPGLADPTGS